MNTKEVVKLACQLFALYFAVSALGSLAWLVPSLFSSGELFSLSYIMPPLVYIGIGFFLWRYAERIATRLVAEPSDVSLTGLSFELLQRLAFSVVGLVFVIQGASELLQYAAFEVAALSGSAGFWGEPVRAAIKLVLGALLLVGIKSVSRFLSDLEAQRIGQNGVESKP